MSTAKFVGTVLLVAGVLILVYGGFSGIRETGQVKLGPIDLTVKGGQAANVPVWAGFGVLLVAGALLLFGGGKD
jgi:hypothetical protein